MGRIIWPNAARTIVITVNTDEDVSAWTLKWRLGRALGANAVLDKSLTLLSAIAKTFTTSLTAAQTALIPGVYQDTVVRTDTGNEDVLGTGSVLVPDYVRAT